MVKLQVIAEWAELETGLESLQGLGGDGCDLAVMAARVAMFFRRRICGICTVVMV